jgi:hypothetical protein
LRPAGLEMGMRRVPTRATRGVEIPTPLVPPHTPSLMPLAPLPMRGGLPVELKLLNPGAPTTTRRGLEVESPRAAHAQKS